MSLGQKQLIAFIRAVLRNPELLILDEATANIDTVTEQLLEDILDAAAAATTTRVIIAHRLNTIDNADEIFFVNGGAVTRGRLDGARRRHAAARRDGRASCRPAPASAGRSAILADRRSHRSGAGPACRPDVDAEPAPGIGQQVALPDQLGPLVARRPTP